MMIGFPQSLLSGDGFSETCAIGYITCITIWSKDIIIVGVFFFSRFFFFPLFFATFQMMIQNISSASEPRKEDNLFTKAQLVSDNKPECRKL